MKYITYPTLALIALLAAQGKAQGISELSRSILQELACERDPRPTGILRNLIQSNKINLDENIGFDSMSCWRLEEALEVMGMKFVSVCAFEENPEIRARNPELYYRGPGSSPGQLISFGSDVSADELASWYFTIYGPTRIADAIRGIEQGWTSLDDPSEVICSSWVRS